MRCRRPSRRVEPSRSNAFGRDRSSAWGTTRGRAIVDERAEEGSLDALLSPRSIAVFGVSKNPVAFGSLAIANLKRTGFSGELFAVHPKEDALHGVRCFRSIDALPIVPDLCVIAVRAELVPETVDACATRGVRAAVVVGSGFAESGTPEGLASQRRIAERARDAGMLLLGPNTLGAAGLVDGAVSAATANLPEDLVAGTVGIVSQSGGLGVTILATAARYGMGVHSFVAVGNEAGIGLAQAIRHFVDRGLSAVLCYFESIRDIDGFRAAAAHARARGVPVVVVKGGTQPAGQAVAAAHTASLAGSTRVLDAALAEWGVARVSSIEALVATGVLFDKIGTAPGGSVWRAGARRRECRAARRCPRGGGREARDDLTPGRRRPFWACSRIRTRAIRSTRGAGSSARRATCCSRGSIDSPRTKGWTCCSTAWCRSRPRARRSTSATSRRARRRTRSPASASPVTHPGPCFAASASTRRASSSCRARKRPRRRCASGWRRGRRGSPNRRPRRTTRRRANASTCRRGPPSSRRASSGRCSKTRRFDSSSKRASRSPTWGVAEDARGAAAVADELGYPVVVKALADGLAHRSQVGAVALGAPRRGRDASCPRERVLANARRQVGRHGPGSAARAAPGRSRHRDHPRGPAGSGLRPGRDDRPRRGLVRGDRRRRVRPRARSRRGRSRAHSSGCAAVGSSSGSLERVSSTRRPLARPGRGRGASRGRAGPATRVPRPEPGDRRAQGGQRRRRSRRPRGSSLSRSAYALTPAARRGSKSKTRIALPCRILEAILGREFSEAFPGPSCVSWARTSPCADSRSRSSRCRRRCHRSPKRRSPRR